MALSSVVAFLVGLALTICGAVLIASGRENRAKADPGG